MAIRNIFRIWVFDIIHDKQIAQLKLHKKTSYRKASQIWKLSNVKRVVFKNQKITSKQFLQKCKHGMTVETFTEWFEQCSGHMFTLARVWLPKYRRLNISTRVKPDIMLWFSAKWHIETRHTGQLNNCSQSVYHQ